MKSAYASFGAAASRGPLEGRTVVERDRAPDPPPMGLMLAAVFAGLVAGAASAKLLHDAAPPAAWIVAAASCGALFALGRTLARRPPSRALLLALLALAFLTFGLLLIAGGESVPRPARRDGIGFAASLALLLAWAGAAVAVPAAIVLAALGLRPPSRSRGRPWSPSPRSLRRQPPGFWCLPPCCGRARPSGGSPR